jgi:hypothetical protein
MLTKHSTKSLRSCQLHEGLTRLGRGRLALSERSLSNFLLILENPCSAWLLGKLQRNPHHPAPAKTRALLLFQLRGALVGAPGPQPAP